MANSIAKISLTMEFKDGLNTAKRYGQKQFKVPTYAPEGFASKEDRQDLIDFSKNAEFGVTYIGRSFGLMSGPVMKFAVNNPTEKKISLTMAFKDCLSAAKRYGQKQFKVPTFAPEGFASKADKQALIEFSRSAEFGVTYTGKGFGLMSGPVMKFILNSPKPGLDA